MSEPPGQVRTEIPNSAGGVATTLISSGRDVEQGARSMLILAHGLFRLDVIPLEDTVQTILRGLGAAERRVELRTSHVAGFDEVSGDATPPSTARFGGEVVSIEKEGGERVVARILVGSVFHPERGETSFTAQARLL